MTWNLAEKILLLIVDILVGIRNAIKVNVWVVTFDVPHLGPRLLYAVTPSYDFLFPWEFLTQITDLSLWRKRN